MSYLLRDLPFRDLIETRFALDAEVFRRTWWALALIVLGLGLFALARRFIGHQRRL
jgi:hypothetical protein